MGRGAKETLGSGIGDTVAKLVGVDPPSFMDMDKESENSNVASAISNTSSNLKRST